MKNTFNTLALVLGAFFVGTMAVQAQVVSSDASSNLAQDAAVAAIVVVTPTPSVDTAQDGPTGIASDPSTNPAQDGAAGIISNPSSNVAQDGVAGIISDPSSNSDQDGPVAPPTDTGGTGGTGGNTSGGGSGGSSSGGSSGSSVFLTYNPTILGAFTTSTTSCPLITDYLKQGGTNNPIQVTKLQIFLKGSENADLTVNGIFDEKTDAAVRNFQKKYMTDILGPWDATRATGFVYITTLKKINALACASPITLSADERAIIEAYKARGAADQTVDGVNSPDNSGTIGSVPSDEVGTTDTDNTAATANASILSRFWSFIKSLFR